MTRTATRVNAGSARPIESPNRSPDAKRTNQSFGAHPVLATKFVMLEFTTANFA
jgi:hypothetical protein